MLANPYRAATFLKSASKIDQLPDDVGIEVAFAGRSNAGKSSALNYLTGNKKLARTSKTPGCTQLINLFNLDDDRRLVDLPGYGYAKVAKALKQNWQTHLSYYLEARQCLRGLVLLMDIRHPLKNMDQELIAWSLQQNLPIHILLTKADKLSRSDVNQAQYTVQRYYSSWQHLLSIQAFSVLKKEGLNELVTKLNTWFVW